MAKKKKKKSRGNKHSSGHTSGQLQVKLQEKIPEDQYLPEIPGQFELGTVGEAMDPWIPTEPELPIIPNYFESGIISEAVPQSPFGLQEHVEDVPEHSPQLPQRSPTGYLSPTASSTRSATSSGRRSNESLWAEAALFRSAYAQSPSLPEIRAPDITTPQLTSPQPLGTSVLDTSFDATAWDVSAPHALSSASRLTQWSPSPARVRPSGPTDFDALMQSILGFSAMGSASPLANLSAQFELTDDERYERSADVNEDIEHMKQKGFIVDTNRRIGFLFTGYFGYAIVNQSDAKGRAFSFADVNQPFVVKWVESDASRGDNSCELFDIEKYILGTSNHDNIVSLRYAFGMGRKTQGRYSRNPSQTFTSSLRQYLILEFADSDLETYLESNVGNVSENDCIRIMKGLLFGLKYLHDRFIFHNDIEARNALVFQSDDQLVAKWTDLSNAIILDGVHPSQAPTAIYRQALCRRGDIDNLDQVFQMVMMCSHLSDQRKQILEKLIAQLATIADLTEINDSFVYL